MIIKKCGLKSALQEIYFVILDMQDIFADRFANG